MKNIEKYPNTNDALAAYNALDLKKVPFGVWLECKFEEPRVTTLLEAAQEVVKHGMQKFRKVLSPELGNQLSGSPTPSSTRSIIPSAIATYSQKTRFLKC